MPADPMATPTDAPRLLLVEDNQLHVRLVTSMLAEIWPEQHIRYAVRLDKAIELALEETPDCVLLDLTLPDADGLEAVQGLLAAVPPVPVIILSAHDDEDLALRAVRAGAEDYLVKGVVGPDRLTQAIRFAIHRHHAAPIDHSLPQTAAVVVPASGTAVVDSEGMVLFAEPFIAELLGRSIEQVVGMPIEGMVHPNDAHAFLRAVSGETDAPGDLTLRLRHLSGNDLRTRVELTPLRDGSGQRSAFVARYYPVAEEGTAASGAYSVVSEWV